MSNEVYANGMEVSCKAAAGQSICAFPDTCFTPPLTPATPPGVPIPYPNTGMSSDTSDGSKTVQITGKEVMLKDSSAFKQSTGDEAGSAPKKNVVTSKIKGKCYFTAYSMDVKFEGENAVRHLDLMTHNHGSTPPGSVPWPYQDNQKMASEDQCATDREKKDGKDGKPGACPKTPDPWCPSPLNIATETFKEQVRKHIKTAKDMGLRRLKKGEARGAVQAPAATAAAEKDDCVKAARCHLKPYKPKKGQKKCCPGQTPHHIPPKSCFKGVGKIRYNKNQALCVCMEGTTQHFGSHGKNHAAIDHLCAKANPKIEHGQRVKIKDYNEICAKAVAVQCGCDPACIKAQLDDSLQDVNREIKHKASKSTEGLTDAQGAGTFEEALNAAAAGPT